MTGAVGHVSNVPRSRRLGLCPDRVSVGTESQPTDQDVTMPVSVDCPRCKHPLSVPESQAGSYIRCPQCRGRLWVPSEEERQEALKEVAQPGGVGAGPVGAFGAGPCRPGGVPPGSGVGPQAGPARPGSDFLCN